MIQFNDVLEESVRELEPHRMVFYLLELAGEFHRYYNRHRVISEKAELTRARLLLLEQIAENDPPRTGSDLGVDAPFKMALARKRISESIEAEDQIMAENRRGKENDFTSAEGRCVCSAAAFTVTAVIMFFLGIFVGKNIEARKCRQNGRSRWSRFPVKPGSNRRRSRRIRLG